ANWAAIGSKATQFYADKLASKAPGYDQRCAALQSSQVSSPVSIPALGYPNLIADNKWVGSPEENFQTLRAAMHFFGTGQVGAIVLDDKTIQALINYDVNFRSDIDVATDIRNLPSKVKYMIVWTIQQNYDQKKLELAESTFEPGKSGFQVPLGKASQAHGYTCVNMIEFMTMRFIHYLGYQCYYTAINFNVAAGLFAGLGEQGRNTTLNSPSYGIATRKTSYLLTDMPIAPKKPIDFGGTKFCETCRRCAERCPGGSMGDESYKKRNWDDYKYGVNGRAGFNGWRVDTQKCKGSGGPSNCAACQCVCPFNHQSEAMLHPIIRAVASTTPVFNGLFGWGDRYMRYAPFSTEKEWSAWWTRDFKTYKGDTIFETGRYKWDI
ncbi:MAG: reductive dehalogenase, partial [Chloroflexi bacterium]|nr:reductive dehalogenase [Chloroflexota bacterium]